LVKNQAVLSNHKIEVLDKRVRPCERDVTADLSWLRPYQLASVDALCSHQRGLISASTGSGKGEVIIGLARALPCRWLFLVHRTSLVEQQAERYERRTGLRAGRVGEGVWSVPADAALVCASFQTLHAGLRTKNPKTLALLDWAQAIACDEVHVVAANTFFEVTMATRNAYYRVGLSGTPLSRGDRKSMYAIGALGRIVHRVKAETLIEAGVLAKPTVRLIEVRQRSERQTWSGVYRESIVKSSLRNAAIVNCVVKAEKPCLVFVTELAHGRNLEKEILNSGIQCAFTHGMHSTELRRSSIKRLTSGHIDVLISSVVFQEGVDIPELRSVVVASGGKSVIATLQRIGRGMRLSKDKDTFEVWDIADADCGCNGQHKGCRWLSQHTQDRLAAYLREGHQTILVR
jgi:superfamily II DNA or RNA helicase